MNQEKIGKFIAECRKNKKLTQEQLAEKLKISDRAISKWERGLNLPDSSLMIELSNILGISVNELLSGEVIDMKNNEKKLEENLLEMVRAKEQADKRMLSLEIIIGGLSLIILLSFCLVASSVEMEEWKRILIIICGFIPFIIGMLFGIKIEQVAGFYECKKCHHRYVPTYNQVLFAMHYNRTRYMKCPKCGCRSWNKKVISK